MVLSSVTAKMAEPSAFPRFLFIGQVYYYLFWYRMMATDGATDALFWGMLVLMVRTSSTTPVLICGSYRLLTLPPAPTYRVSCV